MKITWIESTVPEDIEAWKVKAEDDVSFENGSNNAQNSDKEYQLCIPFNYYFILSMPTIVRVLQGKHRSDTSCTFLLLLHIWPFIDRYHIRQRINGQLYMITGLEAKNGY